jgi:hypothetical protein
MKTILKHIFVGFFLTLEAFSEDFKFSLTPTKNHIETLDEIDLKYPMIEGRMISILDLSDGKDKVLLTLSNQGGKDVRIPRSQLSLDESYLVLKDGKMLPYGVKNHQMIKEIDRLREIRGSKFIEIPQGASVKLILDISKWEMFHNEDNRKETLILGCYIFSMKPLKINLK